jgi:hypothetical protein
MALTDLVLRAHAASLSSAVPVTAVLHCVHDAAMERQLGQGAAKEDSCVRAPHRLLPDGVNRLLQDYSGGPSGSTSTMSGAQLRGDKRYIDLYLPDMEPARAMG